MGTANLAIVITAQNEASKILGQVKGDAGALGGALGGALKVGALAAGAGLIGAGFAMKGFVEEAMNSQKIMAQTNAVLASTHGVAGVTADAITDIADSLSRFTPYDDEAIQSAENLLLTFTSIGKDVFPQATETVLNMSTALGQDLKSSAIQLGKAMNDPITGATALRRVGVALTEQQMAQIKAFQESGNLMGAQAIIMKELQTEFGGSAKAAGDTFAGKMAILGTQIGNVKERIGLALLPMLTKLADLAIKYVVPGIESVINAVTNFVSLIGAFASGDSESMIGLFVSLPEPLQKVALALLAVVEKVKEWLPGLKEIGVQLLETFGPRIVSIFETFRDGVERIGANIATLIQKANDAGVFKAVLYGIAAAAYVLITSLDKLLPVVFDLLDFITSHNDVLAGLAAVVVVMLVPAIVAWTVATWAQLTATASLAAATVIAYAPFFALALVVGLVTVGIIELVKHWDDIKSAVLDAMDYLGGLIERHKWLAVAIAVLGGPIGAVIVAIVEVRRHWDTLKDVVETVLDPIKQTLYWINDAFWNVVDAVQAFIEKLHSIPSLSDIVGGAGDALGFGKLSGLFGHAAGIQNAAFPHMAMVGEAGPELMYVPRGASVFSNARSKDLITQLGGPRDDGPRTVTVNNYNDTVILQGDPAAGLAALGVAV